MTHSITLFYFYMGRKVCSSTHYIRVDFLEQVVFGEIRRLTTVCQHDMKPEFAQIVMGHSIKAAEQEQRDEAERIKLFDCTR